MVVPVGQPKAIQRVSAVLRLSKRNVFIRFSPEMLVFMPASKFSVEAGYKTHYPPLFKGIALANDWQKYISGNCMLLKNLAGLQIIW